MNKTAMMQLIEKYELQLREVRKKIRKVDAIYRDVWRAKESQLYSSIHLAKNLLPTEKQQIEDAYKNGDRWGKNNSASNYFSTTYDTNQ